MKRDELYDEFKRTLPILRIWGKLQMACIILLMLSFPAFIWVDRQIIFKIDATLAVIFIIAGVIYNVTERIVRQEFDEQIKP